MKREVTRDSNYRNIIVLVCLIIAGAKLLIMFLIDNLELNFGNFLLEGLLDALGLILITAPAIYLLVLNRLYSGKDVRISLESMIVKYCLMIFVIKFGLMGLWGIFEFENLYDDNLLDASLAGLLSLPFLYYWVMPPGKIAIEQKEVPTATPPPSMIKIFIYFCLPSFTFVTALIYSIYHTEITNQTILLESNERIQVEMANIHIISELHTVFADLAILANQSELMEMLEGEEHAKPLLQKDYVYFVKNKGHFDQVRFLDAQGMEVIRINYNSGRPTPTVANSLQSKAQRYYFKNTLRLSQGEIFVSPLDLNVENGKVEIPFKPMIRFGTPVFDLKRQKRGAIILNFYGDIVLDQIRSFIPNLPGSLMLINEQGFYLFGPKNDRLWSFMFPDKPQYRFQDEFPEAWSRIAREDQGQFRNSRGLFTFITPQQSKTMKQYREISIDWQINWSNWKLVAFLGTEQEKAAFSRLRHSMVLLSCILCLLIIIGCWLTSKAIVLRFQSIDKSRRGQARQDLLLRLNEIGELNLTEIADYCLNGALELTGSKVGFFATIGGDDTLTIQARSQGVVEQCDIADPTLTYQLENSVLKEVVRSRKARILNDYASLPAHRKSKRLPKGHLEIIRVMFVPVLEDESLSCIVGVANKPYDYDQSDQVQLDSFLGGVMRVLHRRSAQKQINAAKKEAEIANRAKSEFLRNVSHELRTPLSTISGMNYLLEQSGLSVKQKEYTRDMKEAVGSLQSIIGNILDFSRAQKGELKVSSADTFTLGTLLESIVDQVKRKARSKQLSITTAISPEIPAHLVGDPARLTQVLLHLTGNAVKFTDYGKVVIAVEPLEKSGDRITLKFSVKDTGMGLSPQQIEGLFQSFTQVDGSSTRKYGGIGLGLSVSKRLVQLMRGEMSVKSTLGKGSDFSFSVELGVEKKVAQAPGTETNANSGITVTNGEKSEKELDMQSLLLRLHDFAALCAINDTSAAHKFSEIHGAMLHLFPEQTKKIIEKIEEFDFKGASVIVAEILPILENSNDR